MLRAPLDIVLTSAMATAKKKTEVAASRNAGLPQGERRTVTSARTASSSAEPSYEQISERARQIWERNGCPSGRDLENWLQAETELKSGQPTA
jgi:hypothetical protein